MLFVSILELFQLANEGSTLLHTELLQLLDSAIANQPNKKLNIHNANKYTLVVKKSNRKAMNRNWINQKANPALKTKTGNK